MNRTIRKIFLIDDDETIRKSLSLLLLSAGYAIESFNSFEDFIERGNFNDVGCILLDVYLGGKTGLELQEEIKRKYPNLPIIYITGFGDIPMSVHALKKGAINFLQKPIDDVKLIESVEEAIQYSELLIKTQTETDKLKKLVKSLTPREFEILQYVITGILNKQIAAKLGIAEHTVKIHRGKLTEKLGVKSVAEMVHIAEKLGIRNSLMNIE